jgi:uncharacterized protein YbcI
MHMANHDEISRETLGKISQELISLTSRCYGKGPTEAKAYLCDDWLFCVLKNGVTAGEQALVRKGDEEFVRRFRLRFQEHMNEEFTRVVERLTDREVIGYHSQIMFGPDYLVEIYLLGGVLAERDREQLAAAC